MLLETCAEVVFPPENAEKRTELKGAAKREGRLTAFSLLLLVALLSGCGGSSSAAPTVAAAPSPSAPAPSPPTPSDPTPDSADSSTPDPSTPDADPDADTPDTATPDTDTPDTDTPDTDTPDPSTPPPGPIFQLSFPPEISRTEATSITIVGRMADGVEASSVIASANGQETELRPTASGEWRGDLPLASGSNIIALTVSPAGGDTQTVDMATVHRGLVLGFPNDLVVSGDRAYTLDRGRLSNLGLAEIDLKTGEGRRIVLKPNILPPQQLIGQVNGELLVRDLGGYSLLDVSKGTSRSLFNQFRETQQRPFVVALDETLNRFYAVFNAFPSDKSQVLFADIGGALPVSYTQGVSIEPPGAVGFLGLDAQNNDLMFQIIAGAPVDNRPLVTINVDTGIRTERLLGFQDAPISATAALADPAGLVLVDSLGQFFRLEGASLTPVSLLSSLDELATVHGLVSYDGQWLALDSARGNLFRVDPEDGSREVTLSSANGVGLRSSGWHGLLFNDARDELIGVTLFGARAVDSHTGDRSDPLAIEFTPISAGPNFIALPPLADGLSLDAQGDNLFFALVTNVAMGPSEFVRLNLDTGVSETLATINSTASGTLLPRFPSAVIDATRQLAWFFDVDESRGFSRIDLTTGVITDLSLSVDDRPLLSVLADAVNGRLLYATLEDVGGESRLEIIALDHDGQMPETLASIVVNPDATSVIDPRIQMALSPAGDVLYVPLPTTERVAVVDLTNGTANLAGDPISGASGGSVRFSSGLSAAVAPDGRLFLVNGDRGILAIDAGTDAQVVFSR